MSRLAGMFRLVAMLLPAAVTLGLTVPAASAAPPAVHTDADLTALWTQVLETPNPQPFSATPGGNPCWVLPDGTVAPFGPNGVPSCTVKPGTKILVVGSSFECSTFPGDTNPVSPTEAQLRACAVSNDAKSAPPLTVDGQPVPVEEVQTSLMHITLPDSNVFGDLAGMTGLSAGHGWITHLDPLTPGTHTLSSPVFGTTKIVVATGS
jgi:hypothetical protein